MVSVAVPKIVVDETKCIAAGECIYNHPEYFAWGDDGTIAVVRKPDIVTDIDRLHADQAIALCPGMAIAIDEDWPG
jgi:ferredoxin